MYFYEFKNLMKQICYKTDFKAKMYYSTLHGFWRKATAVLLWPGSYPSQAAAPGSRSRPALWSPPAEQIPCPCQYSRCCSLDLELLQKIHTLVPRLPAETAKWTFHLTSASESSSGLSNLSHIWSPGYKEVCKIEPLAFESLPHRETATGRAGVASLPHPSENT